MLANFEKNIIIKSENGVILKTTIAHYFKINFFSLVFVDVRWIIFY